MPAVYAKTSKTVRFFFALSAVLLLSGCDMAGRMSGAMTGMVTGRTPWDLPVNTGVVTRNPDSLPDIAWQTPGQRQVLSQQSETFARQQTAAEHAARAQQAPLPPPVAKSQRKTVVELLLPLTGKNAELGQAMLKAAQMALFDVGSANVELKPRDTRNTQAGAAEAARKALDDHADLVLGPIFTEDLKTVKPVLSGSGIPVVAFSTDWTQADANTYIMGFLPFAQVARIAQYAESRGYPRISVYAPQTEYCNVVITTLQRTAAHVSRIERYSPQESNLPTIVQSFVQKSKGADGKLDFDALMLPVGGEGLHTLASLLDANGVNAHSVRLLGTGLWDDSAISNYPALHGGWYAAPDPRLRADFERRYQGNYGMNPPRLASLAYDATALAAVLARGETSGTPFSRANLTNARGFAGIDGIFRFRADGLAERGLAILEVQSGKPKLIDPAPTAFISSGT